MSCEERNRHLLIEGITVDVIYPGAFWRRTARWDPGNITINEQDDIGIFGQDVEAEARESKTLRGNMARWEAHIAAAGILDADARD